MRHSPAGEGGSLTVPTAHGPPHSASGRRLGSRLFIIKPVKNTSQTASELQTDGCCLLCAHYVCARSFSPATSPSKPGSRLWLDVCGCSRTMVRAYAQPDRAKTLLRTQHHAQSWSAGQNEMRAQPCPVHRETERFCCPGDWRQPARHSSTTVLLALGKHRRPRRPAGIRFLGVINQGFATISLRVLRWLQHSWGDGLKGNCALPPSSCSSQLSESAMAMVIKR